MSKIALEEISTKDPHQAEQGDVVKGSNGVFVKIKSFVDDKIVKGKIVYAPDDEAEGNETEMHLDDCECGMTPHQWGQAKRFTSKGTGFSKKGRKLKYPRHDLFDSNEPDVIDARLESYIDGDINDGESLLQETIKSDVVNIFRRALPEIVDDVDSGFAEAIRNNRVDEQFKAILSKYERLAQSFDCSRAVDKLESTVRIELEQMNVLPAPEAIEKIQDWIKQNLTDIWCP